MLDAPFHRGSVSGKVLSDVSRRGGAENRVGDGMTDDVGIGVPERATLGRHGHAAEHERPAFHQPVQVVAHAYPSRGAGRLHARPCARRHPQRS